MAKKPKGGKPSAFVPFYAAGGGKKTPKKGSKK